MFGKQVRGIPFTLLAAMALALAMPTSAWAELLRLERRAKAGGKFWLDSFQSSRELAERKAGYLRGLGYETRIVPASASERRRAEGEALYKNIGCAGCHRADGRGDPGLVPPLSGSDFVKERPPATLAALLLLGAEGPMKVKGEEYDGAMPGFAASLDDEQIASILTYLRMANGADPVEAAVVHEARRAASGRTAPWTIAELDALEVPRFTPPPMNGAAAASDDAAPSLPWVAPTGVIFALALSAIVGLRRAIARQVGSHPKSVTVPNPVIQRDGASKTPPAGAGRLEASPAVTRWSEPDRFFELIGHDAESVIRACDRALGRDPDNSLGRFIRGLALQELGRYGEGLHELERAIQKEPRLASACHRFAIAEWNRQGHDDVRLSDNINMS
jgi:mono/diheme cytochrome c family protein